MYASNNNDMFYEILCGNNFEYVLKDNVNFANTDYKVLQSHNNGIFIKCMKITRNGKTSLFYITEDYKPMSSMLVGINADTLINVVINLFADVIEVRNNGFLVCQCIDLSWDKVYVEPNTLKVKLVYLPFDLKENISYADFESELRSRIVKLINNLLDTNDRLKSFVLDLCNGSLSLEEVYNRTRNAGASVTNSAEINNSIPKAQATPDNIKLVALNAPGFFEIIIDKDDLLLGKKQELVDKCIPYSKLISRKHCRIVKHNALYYLQDEGSLNGTFINGVRLTPGQSIQMNRGDIIKMADCSFKVCNEE